MIAGVTPGDIATIVLAVVGFLTLLGGAIKLGIDVGSLKKEIKPNGGDTHSLGDTVFNVKQLLQEHLENDERRTKQIGDLLLQGQQELLAAVKANKPKSKK